MKGKFSVTLLLMGLTVAFYFYWGSNTYGASAFAADIPVEPVTTLDSDPPVEAEESIAPEEVPLSIESPYATCAHYIAEYEDRYLSYRQREPELDLDTIVWHVNAGLDQDAYQTETDTEGDPPLVVNKRHGLPEGYEPEALVKIHGNIMATPGTAEAFGRMRKAAMADGIYIEAAAGYRSFDRQQELFEAEERYRGAQAAEEAMARPGFTEHSTGRALHIVDRNYTYEGFEQMPEYVWLVENCADYGFILRYGQDTADITGFAYEPYHFTFVGREIALDMKASDIETLEEYTARGLVLSDNPIDDRTAVALVAQAGQGVESTYRNDIVQRIKEHLEEENLRVVVANDSHDIENGSKVDIALVFDGTSASPGAVAWFDSSKPESRALAETVSGRLAWSGLPAQSRVLGGNGSLPHLTPATAILIEAPGSMDLARTENRERMAKSISNGIVAHLGIRKMYLTFDDGPSAKNTPMVLDILKEKGVKATFFVIGEMAEEYPELLERIVAEGHTIGIHCYNHDYSQLYASVESFVDDFYRAREVVQGITGVAPTIYRFPGGSINHYNKGVYKQIIEEMDRLGFVYYDWNLSVDDAARGVKVGDLMNNIQGYPRHPYAVLLMHDAYPHIAEELGDILEYYSDYQMRVIDEDTEPVHL